MVNNTQEARTIIEPWEVTAINHGDCLSNGAIVLLAGPVTGLDHARKTGLFRCQTLLCMFQDNYVTWHWNCETRGADSGNYFPGLNSLESVMRAIEDFTKRTPKVSQTEARQEGEEE